MPKGVFPARNNWTPSQADEVRELIHEGYSYAQIGKRIGRSATAVHVWTKRNMGNVRDVRPMSARDVNGRMGKCDAGTWCQSLIARGWLKARRGIGAKHNRTWVISEEALFEFLENPAFWHTWDAGAITVTDWREWALEMRTDRFLTVGQVADRYFVTSSTVNSWIARGVLVAQRWGNHYIASSAIDGFVPPYERSKAGKHPRRFTSAEDARLIELRDGGASWAECEYQLHRSMGSCAGRYARLVARRMAVAA